MELLEEEDPDRYQSQFAKFIAKEIEGDQLQEMYQKAHEAVRALLPRRAVWGS
jgi:large subunit ribosomal protein L5e